MNTRATHRKQLLAIAPSVRAPSQLDGATDTKTFRSDRGHKGKTNERELTGMLVLFTNGKPRKISLSDVCF